MGSGGGAGSGGGHWAEEFARGKQLLADAGDPSEGLRRIRRAALAGHAPAMTELGRLAFQGVGGRISDEEARHWAARAAEEGDPEGMFLLSFLLSTGTGGAVDLEGAHRLARKAAEAGMVEAMGRVGLDLWRGEGVPRDLEAARSWLLCGAEAGSPYCQRHLANLLRLEFPADPGKSARWLERAASQGDSYACVELAGYFLVGFGIPEDPIQAEALLRRARLFDGQRDRSGRWATVFHRGKLPGSEEETAGFTHLAEVVGGDSPVLHRLLDQLLQRPETAE